MVSSQKKMVILSVSAGAGHVRAAEALTQTAADTLPAWDALHLDVMDFVPKLFRKLYAESYVKIINRHPALWGYMYRKSDRVEDWHSKMKKFRVAVERLNTRKLFKALAAEKPDTIVCTHFLPAELISRLFYKEKLATPCWVQVTDFDVHGLWIHDHMAGYFAASDEVAWRMRARGIPADRTHVTGIPISPAFNRSLSREACAEEVGLSPDKPILLLMAGGLGVGDLYELAEKLLETKGDFQLIALAGKNKALLADLKKLAKQHPGKLLPMGFTRTIERLMAASDLAISKPGGLTTSECLAMGLPMIVVSPIPGQEERNADYLLENGAAMKAHDAGGLVYRVQMLMEKPALLKRMQKNARVIGRPKAAAAVLRIVTKRGR